MLLAVVIRYHCLIRIFNKRARITQLDQQYGLNSLSSVGSCLGPIFSNEQPSISI